MPQPFVALPRGVARAPAASAPPRRAPHPALLPFGEVAADPAVTDLFVNGDRGLFADRGAGAEPVPGWVADEAEVRRLATALIALGGRHIDETSPCVDVRLEGGVRVHAVLPPVSAVGTLLSVRIPAVDHPSLDDLHRRGAVDSAQRAWLEKVVRERENLLISGASGTGKTTLLSALLSAVPATERIVCIEDVAELRAAHPHRVTLEARQPNLEGVGGVGLARLVREALRMRPDRLVVGECRGEEVRELLSALNTGHDGGAGTLHANSLEDVPARLEALGALAGLEDTALARQAVSALSWVLYLERDAAGTRRLARAGRLRLDAAGRLAVERSEPWR